MNSGTSQLPRVARRVAPWLAVVLAASGFTVGGGAGCLPLGGGGGGGTGPTNPPPTTALAPRYVLESVNGLQLPVTLRQEAGRIEAVAADTLLFALATPTVRSGTFTEITVIETREGTAAPVTTRQESAPGSRTFTRGDGVMLEVSTFVGGTGATGSAVAAIGPQPAAIFLYDRSGRSWRYVAR